MEGRDLEPPGTDAATAENLKRLATMLSVNTPLTFRINGRRVTLPEKADLRIDLDRDANSGCVEVDIRWSEAAAATGQRVGPQCGGTGEPHRKAGNSSGGQGSPGPHIRIKALVLSPEI
jgi:hypothetical protein